MISQQYQESELTSKIITCAFKVYKTLGIIVYYQY